MIARAYYIELDICTPNTHKRPPKEGSRADLTRDYFEGGAAWRDSGAGDSTTAFCVDKRRECYWGELSGEIYLERGEVDTSHFGSRSGDGASCFVKQALYAEGWGAGPFGVVLLIGGWDSSKEPRYCIERDLSQLVSHAKAKLQRNL